MKKIVMLILLVMLFTSCTKKEKVIVCSAQEDGVQLSFTYYGEKPVSSYSMTFEAPASLYGIEESNYEEFKEELSNSWKQDFPQGVLDFDLTDDGNVIVTLTIPDGKIDFSKTQNDMHLDTITQAEIKEYLEANGFSCEMK
ncbi:MAG: hypothetical protein LBR25_04785 [Erysipelotrichaceae bacterium]|jgi:hypothetical protein|nr:hypothetical protein [Erysipelotrichaceae bacterium]